MANVSSSINKLNDQALLILCAQIVILFLRN